MTATQRKSRLLSVCSAALIWRGVLAGCGGSEPPQTSQTDHESSASALAAWNGNGIDGNKVNAAVVNAGNGSSFNGSSINGNSINGNNLSGVAVNGGAANGNLINPNSYNGASAGEQSIYGAAVQGANGELDGIFPYSVSFASLDWAVSSYNFAAWFAINEAQSDGKMTYLVRCALASNQTLRFASPTIPGKYYTWPGSLGLGTAWTGSVPTTADKEWSTACFLSFINGLGLNYQLSFRAPYGTPGNNATNNTFSSDPAERDAYPHMEAAFFGNIFQAAPGAWLHVGYPSENTLWQPDKFASYSAGVGRAIYNSQIAQNTWKIRNDPAGGRFCGGCQPHTANLCGLTCTGGVQSDGLWVHSWNHGQCEDSTGQGGLNGWTSCFVGHVGTQTYTAVVTTFIPQYCGDGYVSDLETNLNCADDAFCGNHHCESDEGNSNHAPLLPGQIDCPMDCRFFRFDEDPVL